ncbi:MAG: hypothetical protein ACP5G4_10280, partial [bacterium]
QAAENSLAFDPDFKLPVGDTLFYSLYDKSDNKLAESMTIYYLDEEGLRIIDLVNQSEVLVDPASLTPISGQKVFQDGQQQILVTSTIVGDSVQLFMKLDEQEEVMSIAIPKSSFLHNDQLLFSFPALDFAQKRHDFQLFVPASGTFIQVAALVGKPESIEVPAGEYSAYPVTFDFGVATQKAWYEAEGSHRLIIYDNGQIQYRLDKD